MPSLGAAACAGGGGGDGSPTGGSGGVPALDKPHALAQIRVSETRDVGSNPVASLPTLGAQLKPDVTTTTACTKAVGGCRTPIVAECQGCTTDQYCALDTNCHPTCIDFCSLQCAENEVCYLASPGSPACVPTEVFDAGTVTIDGAWQEFVLTSPDYYSSGPAVVGITAFSSQAKLQVQASGTTSAGFKAFDQEYTATTIIKSNLADLKADVFAGTGDVTITWPPGTDQVSVSLGMTAADNYGVPLTCPADDKKGKLVVPRATILAALAGHDLASTLVYVSRFRHELRDRFATTGSLPRSTVRPNGILDLGSSSTEYRTFYACPADPTLCPPN